METTGDNSHNSLPRLLRVTGHNTTNFGHSLNTLLADRTNGRAIGTVLRLSVCRLSSVVSL